jgi:RNA polymerase sigma-70 factor (ECF subfamily)
MLIGIGAGENIASASTKHGIVAADVHAREGRARRFHDAASPYLNDVYTLAWYLMRNQDDAEDAVQECYFRGLRYFDSYHGPAMKPWLLAILRNVCLSELTRRGKQEVPMDYSEDEAMAERMGAWPEPQASPESVLSQQQDNAAIRRLIATLPPVFREVVVLREINDLSYREIANLAGVPVGTVMSRLARARSMLRIAWNNAQAHALPVQ